VVALLAARQDLRETSRERRSREDVVNARLMRCVDEICLHVRNKGDSGNGRERRVASHGGDGTKRICTWTVQIENDERRGVRSHFGKRGL